MSKNYYDELLDKINKFIKNNDENNAIQLIEEELNLPYVPIEYEQKLKDIYQKINPIINKQKQMFSKDEIIDIFLIHYKEHSNDFLFEVSQMMNSYSWNDSINELQNIFNLNDLKNNIKGSIYNILSIQNINYDFLIDGIKLNPCKNLTVFENDFAIKNFNDLSNNYFGEPTLIDVAKKTLMIYLLNQFPHSMKFQYIKIDDKLINIAKVMLGQQKENFLTQEETKIYDVIKSNN